MNVHVVTVNLIQTLGGSPVTDSQLTIGQKCQVVRQPRIIPTNDVPNSENSPTIKDYLIAEASDGFKLAHMDQYTIVTYDT